MVWLGTCPFKNITPLVILDEGTLDRSYYIRNVLPVALKCGNEVSGDKWIFQQDGTNPHRRLFKRRMVLG